jgi:streptogramin lyase
MESKDPKENQRDRSSFRRSRIFRWLRGIIIAVVLLCITVYVVLYISYHNTSFGAVADCFYNVEVFTWVDINADGILQEGEPPLPGVNILIDDKLPRVTNSEGEIQFGSGFVEGCPPTKYKITAEGPVGYRPTTAGPQFYRESGGNQSFQFGFTYLPGVPTLTPRPKPQLSCAIVPEFTWGEINSIASDKWGLWIASSGKVARLDFSTNNWDVYPGEKAYAGEAYRIFVGPDESVWLVTLENVYRLNDGEWEKFSPDPLTGKVVSSIVWAPNDNVWFFLRWDPKIIIWNPHTNIWTSDKSDAYIDDTLFASDGKYIQLKSNGGAIAPDGKVWGVLKAGGYRWEGDYYDPVTHKIVESPTFYDCYNDMKFDEQGGMWLATCNAGLLYIPDPLKGSQAGWYEYHQDIGFASDETNALFFQGDDILWIGTKEGLARCQIETQ